MNDNNLTARLSAFARAFHYANHLAPVFADCIAPLLFSAEEYAAIASYLSEGISFFDPNFQGTAAQALRHVVDTQLAPSPLGRSAFCEQALALSAQLGVSQYLLLGAGLDTFSLRQPAWAQALQIFELDQPALFSEKRQRLASAELSLPDNVQQLETDLASPDWAAALYANPAFSDQKRSFVSALGLSYYLSAPAFGSLLQQLSRLCPPGSSLVFDYPVQEKQSTAQTLRQQQLAVAAGEPMCAAYTESALTQLLAGHGFLVYEHLTPAQIDQRFFHACCAAQPEYPIRAFPGVCYVLAVRKD